VLVMVACVMPDFVGSSTLVAETETVFGEGVALGAVKSPEAFIVPRLKLPPGTPFTVQDTAGLNAPVPITVATNCSVPRVGTDTEVGDTATDVIVGD
jgi:hypothetical protein